MRGRLLVASPGLADPNFARTVVLVLEHGDDGALGVTLNRPSTLAVADALPDWAGAVDPPAQVFAGGPVGDGAVIGLAWTPSGMPGSGADPASGADPDGGAAPGGRVPLFGGLATIDLSRPPASFAALDGVRIFGGYAGWAPGQLDGEVEAGGWFVADADIPGDVLTPDAEQLWRRVLRRQEGRLAVFAHFPDDPSAN